MYITLSLVTHILFEHINKYITNLGNYYASNSLNNVQRFARIN